MKNIITVIIVAFAFSAIAQESIPEYTTIDKLYKVSPGMTEDEVTALIGIPPYDIYHDVANNCKVLVWHYRHKQHSIPSSQEHTRASLDGGKITYVNTEKVYMTFSENDKKLINYFTDQGKARSISLIKAGRDLLEICDDPSNVKIKGNNNDKTIIRSLNHHRFGAFFKLGLSVNPDGASDILIGGQYRYIFKPYTNQKNLSVDAKLLYNLTAKDVTSSTKTDSAGAKIDFEEWNDHLILSIPVYVCYNYKSWSFGAGLHLNIGNEGVGDEQYGYIEQKGDKEGYDHTFSVPVIKIGYNLYDKVNFEYNLDLSGNGQETIGVGYYWNF
ncbi:hypothetical protein OAV36_04030 [Flavobacteriales bacterium]|jgi:hypothetical protein|nr:hypothetical protein [Flavobacteriales bacterium]MDC3394744.1 hypothetical protein [Flavobacteriales bacterium]